MEVHYLDDYLGEEGGAVSFYVDVKPGELADLEAVSSAAIAWSQAMRAAAAAIYPEDEFRVTLIAAEKGSSKWLAMIERSSVNQMTERAKKKWSKIPLVIRVGLGLVVVVPTTAVPTYEYWTGDQGFSEKQKKELEEIVNKGRASPAVEGPKRTMYRSLQRDPKITGVGVGVPTSIDWKPVRMVPANQFAEAEGLFSPLEADPDERTLSVTMDVILVSPHLDPKPRSWTFRQEGLPGTFPAIMSDHRFLAGLDQKAVRESLRTHIPMRIRMDVKQRFVDGEWKVVRKGRQIVEVISPQVDLP